MLSILSTYELMSDILYVVHVHVILLYNYNNQLYCHIYEYIQYQISSTVGQLFAILNK